MALRVWFPTFPCRVCLSKCLLWVWLPDIPCRVCLSNVRCSSHHTADGSSGLAPAISMSSLPLECSLCRATTLLMALVSDRGPTSAHYTKRAHFCDSSSWDAFGRLSSLALGLSMSGLAPERSICVIVAVDRFPNLCSICAVVIVARACFLAAAGGDPREFTRKDTLSNPLLCRIDVSCARFSVRPHPLVRCQNLCHLRPTLVTPRPTQLPAQVSAVNLPSPSSNSSCDYSLNFCMFVSMCWSVLYELSMHKLVGCLQAPVTFRS